MRSVDLYRHSNLKLLLIAFLLVSSSIVNGQNASELLNLARSKKMVDMDSSNWYAMQAYHASLDQSDDSLALQAQFVLATNLKFQGKRVEAQKIFREIIENASIEQYEKIVLPSIAGLGELYSALGQFDSAMVYLLWFDELVDLHWGNDNSDAKLLLGELYRAMGDMQRSDEYKLEAIRRAELGGDRMKRILALYYYLSDHPKEMHTEAFQEYFNDYLELVDQQNTSGHTHLMMLLKDVDDTERMDLLKKAEGEARKAERRISQLIFLRSIVNLYLEQENFEEALPYAETGLEMALKIKDKLYEQDFTSDLYRCYEGQKKYFEAIQYLKAYTTLKDSLNKIRVNQNLDELNVQYETSQKEQRIMEQALALQKNKNQRNLLWIGIAMLLWFGTFLVIYFWNRNRVTRKLSLQKAQIDRQEIDRLEQERSILAMSSMIEGQEAERKRIAQDLHDGLGGLLSNIKAQIHEIERKVDALSEIDVSAKASEMIDEASKEVRRIAYNMMPTALTKFGLKAAIEDLAVTLTRFQKLNVQAELNGLDERLSETKEVMLYRIIQELCNNVVKHAQAHSLMIQTTRIENDLIVVVEDDGIGFDLHQTNSAQGVGMKSIESRVKFLDGDLDISSNGDGTCVTIQVPLQ